MVITANGNPTSVRETPAGEPARSSQLMDTGVPGKTVKLKAVLALPVSWVFQCLLVINA